MKTIGITNIDPLHILDIKSSLINDLIYFDEILYTNEQNSILEEFFSKFDGGKVFKNKAQEIEYLENSGLIREYKKKERKDNDEKYRDEKINKLFLKIYSITRKLYDEQNNDKPFESKKFDNFFLGFRNVSQLENRVNSLVLNKKDENNYVPIIKEYYDLPFLNDDNTIEKSDQIISVVLKKFPLISSNIPVESFVEFKKDDQTKLKLSRLRNWVLDISNQNFSAKEIEQKMEYLIAEYTHQIELHKLKYSYSQIETITLTGLEVIENLLSLKFSKAAKALFDINRQELNLLEAENKITGKEMALIYDLRKEIAYNNI